MACSQKFTGFSPHQQCMHGHILEGPASDLPGHEENPKDAPTGHVEVAATLYGTNDKLTSHASQDILIATLLLRS